MIGTALPRGLGPKFDINAGVVELGPAASEILEEDVLEPNFVSVVYVASSWWLPLPGMEIPVSSALAVSVIWFSRMLTLLLPVLATAKSEFPSPSKSATASAVGLVPTT